MSWNQLCSSQITQNCFAQDTPPTHCSKNLQRMCSASLRPCLFTSDIQCWCELGGLFPSHLLKKGEAAEGPMGGDFPEQAGILCEGIHTTQSLFSLWQVGSCASASWCRNPSKDSSTLRGLIKRRRDYLYRQQQDKGQRF